MKSAPLYAFAVCSLVMACGSDDGSTEQPKDVSAGTTACGLSSGFPGDELCILPPAAGEGIQLHAGPANYTDDDVLEPWIIYGGEEDVRCYLVRVPESGFYYLKQQNRMRSGSHHMLIGLVADEGQPEGPANCDSLGSLGSIPGSQIPKRDFPDQLAPEDAGLARYLPEGAMASFQMHYVNTTDEPMLREAWVNLYRLEDSEVRQRLQSVFLVADITLDIPANTRQTVTQEFAPTLTEPTRIFQLNAHMHAHTESFSVWRLRGDERELVYKSFDWAEPDILTYNTVVDNSPPDDAAKRDGGVSGVLYLEPGDRLQWSCDVNNTLNQPMGFANEAYTAEMCLLAGSYVSDTPGLFAGACANGTCFSRAPSGN
jgi:hypothetical protein